MQIEVIPRFKIDGEYYTIGQLPPEVVRKLVRERVDLGMMGINYEREKSTCPSVNDGS